MTQALKILRKTVLSTVFVAVGVSQARAAQTYILTLTNGGMMPLSPAVILVKDGADAAAKVGSAPTAGFVKLCQSGDPSLRAQELQSTSGVRAVMKTTAPIMPGETRSIEVMVASPAQQSIQFETMYGKTKDTCALGSVNSHALAALESHVTPEIDLRDNVVQTGAFQDPALSDTADATSYVCNNVQDAISCVRELAKPMPNGKIRFASAYLPSILTFLESKYGAKETQSLQIASAGAVQIQVRLKH